MPAAVKTQIHYHTKSGSIYVRTVDETGESWHRETPDGKRFDLAGGMHLTRQRLQQIITDYPANVMDKTACLCEGVAIEFFFDAKHHASVDVPEHEESTIFFLINRGLGQYGIGHSSRIEKVETVR